MTVSAAGPAASPGFLLWRTTLRWQRAVVLALRPLALTHVQFVLLATTWWLASRPDRDVEPSQREVAEHAATDVMMTSQVLRALEQRGLVSRTADVADARVKRLDVTAAGAVLARHAVELVEAADQAFFAGVAEPDRLLGELRDLAGWPERG